MEKPEVVTQEYTQDIDDLKRSITIDTVHNDEALKVLGTYNGSQTWEPEEEKRLIRKIDRRVVPILCVTYALTYYDKAMLSQAALFGLRTDLKLGVGNRYSFSASIFYLGFIAGAYPAVLMAQRWPIERVTSSLVLVWGVCLMCTAACQNFQGLYVQRFFLGVLESGISPMFMLVVGSWYKKDEQALRMGAWYCCTAYVTVVSPILNYGLGHIKGSLSPWRYMYLVAGSITILWAIAIYFFMAPDPIRAGGFTDRERYIAVARLRVNNSGIRNTHFKWAQALDALGDIKFWLTFSMAFMIMVANGPIASFVPIILNSFGFSTLNSLLLTSPLGAIGGTVQILSALAAYKIPRSRTYIMLICELVTVMSCLLLWLLPRDQKGGLLFGVYSLGVFSGAYAVIIGLQAANTAGYTKRSVTSSGLFIGYCLGNLVGPLVFRPQDAPHYTPGLIVVMSTAAAGGVLSMVYRIVVIRENKRRDETGELEGYEHAYEDDITDRMNPQFRYVM